MNYTANYRLPQWVEDDRILMEDFNQAMETIDAGLHSKASGETVTALAESVDSQLEAIAANLGSGGKTCRVAYGSYTGTGTYGSSSPNRLTLPFVPYLVLVYDSTGSDELHLTKGCGLAGGYGNKDLPVSWSDKQVSWYAKDSAINQYNKSERTYFYVAFGICE